MKFLRCNLCRPEQLPEVPLAEAPLADVLLLDVPLAEVPQPLDPEAMDPEVAEPVPEQESSWRMMSNMSLNEELASLLLPWPCERLCKNTNGEAIPLENWQHCSGPRAVANRPSATSLQYKLVQHHWLTLLLGHKVSASANTWSSITTSQLISSFNIYSTFRNAW